MRCGVGPCGATSAVSLPWNIGRPNSARPPSAFTAAQVFAMSAADGEVAAEDLEALRREILTRAGDVARASGGLLGFGEKISPTEQAVLAELQHAFG